MTKMRKKDYELLAKAIAKAWVELMHNDNLQTKWAGHNITVEKIIEALQSENPQFDAVKFDHYSRTVARELELGIKPTE